MLALQLIIVFGVIGFPLLVILFANWGSEPPISGGDLWDRDIDEPYL